ncbi:hypothetical protein EZV62_006455 [Acer yangbiense]|uniref:TF-B3 domain-containing protein n=1 Tax=Acer yangbiense TaxID=1000413 RepID=A0A5C7I788_9ROSI|nr:hypothetical protein EZV62_006455 [Acer yangbiense]
MAMSLFVISKKLTITDITTRKCEIPSEILKYITLRNGQHSIQLMAADIRGKEWELHYYTRPRGRKCLVFTTGWRQFVEAKRVQVGDELVFSGHQVAAADHGEPEMQYMIQVKRPVIDACMLSSIILSLEAKFSARMDFEKFLKEFDVEPKNPSEAAIRRWRSAFSIVKNRRRRFRMRADLDKRSEADQKKLKIQCQEISICFAQIPTQIPYSTLPVLECDTLGSVVIQNSTIDHVRLPSEGQGNVITAQGRADDKSETGIGRLRRGQRWRQHGLDHVGLQRIEAANAKFSQVSFAVSGEQINSDEGRGLLSVTGKVFKSVVMGDSRRWRQCWVILSRLSGRF